MMKRFERWLSLFVLTRFRAASLLGDKPFFFREDLPATRDLQEHWPAIREEVDKIMERYEELTPFQTMSPDQEGLSDDDRWKFFFLKCARIRFRKNIALMPHTMSIIDRHPEIVSAYLSILAPGKSLPPHQGPWAGVLRAHLGVTIPMGRQIPRWSPDGEPPRYQQITRPTLIVNGLHYQWKEGEVVFFDDTYEHEANNPTDEIRVVLFMDIVRPMRAPWSWLNRLVLNVIWIFPYVWVPYFRHKKWEKKFHG